MNSYSEAKRYPRILFVLLAVAVSACARTDYSPTIRDQNPAETDRSKRTQSSGQNAGPGEIIIRRGDTLYGIARRHGIPIRKLIEANGLKPPYIIYPGRTLKTPISRFHIAKSGETTYGIARLYGVDMGTLVRINNIQPPYRLKRGQKLLLPDRGGRTSTSRHASRVQQKNKKPGIRRVSGPKRLPGDQRSSRTASQNHKWSRPDPRPLKTPPRRSGRKFLWPVKGRVIVGFGPRKGGFHNDGINISARAGTPIRAAENGVVAYVGNQLQGFGNLVLIKHSGGWMSAYAHGSSVLVRRGSVVRRGQTIARVGRTGNVSRPQLHFELRRGDKAVDPRRYLVRFAYRLLPRKYAFRVVPQDLE
ncbi:MAG: peptidase M23 [Rhodospirillaceae bacterium]|nr:peptidase M23 [Rhodospirillaceae bacterium]